MNAPIEDIQWCRVHVKEEGRGDQVHVHPVFQYTHMEQWAQLSLKSKVSSTGREWRDSLRLLVRTLQKYCEECGSVLWNRKEDGQQQMTRRKLSLQTEWRLGVFTFICVCHEKWQSYNCSGFTCVLAKLCKYILKKILKLI